MDGIFETIGIIFILLLPVFIAIAIDRSYPKENKE